MDTTKNRMLRGSVTVEAAMIVPLFFLLMIPFLYLMRQSLTQAALEFALDDALFQMSVESYAWIRLSSEKETLETISPAGDEETAQGSAELAEMADEADSVFYMTEGALEDLVIDLGGALYLKNRMLKNFTEDELMAMGVENGSSGISFSGSRFFYEESDHTHLIQAVCSISWESPFVFFHMPDSLLVRTTRCFTGADRNSQENPFPDQEDNQSDFVYRIGEGSHYHQRSCYLISKNILELSASQAAARGLIACERCRPDQNIQTVYITDGGYRYHTANCSYLFPNLQEMSLEDALSLGLAPCGLCVGGEDYFRK